LALNDDQVNYNGLKQLIDSIKKETKNKAPASHRRASMYSLCLFVFQYLVSFEFYLKHYCPIAGVFEIANTIKELERPANQPTGLCDCFRLFRSAPYAIF
jgi:hypothetical protein